MNKEQIEQILQKTCNSFHSAIIGSFSAEIEKALLQNFKYSFNSVLWEHQAPCNTIGLPTKIIIPKQF